MARTSPGMSPLPTSAPELVTTASDAGDEGSRKASSRKHKDVLGLPPVDCASQANTTAILDVLPQLPPLPSVTDIVVTTLSQQKFDVEHTRDPPPNTSQFAWS